MILAFPAHPFAYFFTFGYLIWFELPLISLEGLSYREESIVSLLNTHCIYSNATLDMDKVGETRRHQWKERLKISKFS